jgi:4-amino-4-deoxy-L-arabinose transferase-like glycosyltransferase
VVAIFVVVFVALSIEPTFDRSATFDEPLHLTAGYAALAAGDFRIDPTHPPFSRMWAAAPLVAMPAAPIDTSAVDRVSGWSWLLQSVAFSRAYLYDQSGADGLLHAGRLMTVVWGIVLGVLLFRWAHEWLGFWAGVLALLFYTTSPNLQAHASLVTTDLPVTCFFFGAIYAYWRWTRTPGPGPLAGLLVCTGLAVVTKFTGLLLAPALVVLLAMGIVGAARMPWQRGAALAGALLASTVLVIWTVYGFRYAPSDSPGWLFHLDETPLARTNAPVLSAVGGWIDAHRLLPNAFTEGLLMSEGASQSQAMYLAGEYSRQGWWYYFPVAFLLKTPLAIVLLAGVGVYAAVRRHIRPGVMAFLAVPVGVVMVFAMTSGINIGVRHILPVYPFVILIAAAGACEAWARAPAGRAVTVGLMIFLGAQFARVYPHTLTFFSQIVGGSAQGIQYLADSNLDWGQHLKLLKTWMDERGVSHVNLAYFGTADPDYYGIDATLLPGTPVFDDIRISKPVLPGYVAISVNMLSGQYLAPEWRYYYRPFLDLAPVAEIGNTIRVYWVDAWPENGRDEAAEPASPDVERALARGLTSLQSYRHAAVHYRDYLQRRPDDAVARARLGMVLAKSGDLEGGIRALERAGVLAPESAAIRQDLVATLLAADKGPRALEVAERGVERMPRDALARYTLAMVLADEDRTDEAAAELARALEIDPAFRPAHDALAQIGGAD